MTACVIDDVATLKGSLLFLFFLLFFHFGPGPKSGMMLMMGTMLSLSAVQTQHTYNVHETSEFPFPFRPQFRLPSGVGETRRNIPTFAVPPFLIHPSYLQAKGSPLNGRKSDEHHLPRRE